MTMPLISILCPVWNEERYLPEMIRSVQDQSYQTWELVLVDDGSSDRTVEIARKCAAEDSRIRLVGYGVRLGKVRAFNLAAEHALGEIVCHLGGDDLATPVAMTARASALAGHLDSPAVAFFKISAFTDDPGKGTVLPRGSQGSRSGPSSTFTRALAQKIFPVPVELPSEDLWLGEAAAGLADTVVHSDAVVCSYRMHGGNSNPRGRSFEEMSRAIGARMAFAPRLLESFGDRLDHGIRRELDAQWEMEQLRAKGDVWGLLRYPAPLVERLAVASMADRRLWRLRQAAGRGASGWRQR